MPSNWVEKWHFVLKEKQIILWTWKTNEWMFVKKHKVNFGYTDVYIYICVCFILSLIVVFCKKKKINLWQFIEYRDYLGRIASFLALIAQQCKDSLSTSSSFQGKSYEVIFFYVLRGNMRISKSELGFCWPSIHWQAREQHLLSFFASIDRQV